VATLVEAAVVPAAQGIVAVLSIEAVVAVTTVEPVVPGTPEERVPAVAAGTPGACCR
jgi:hypothetical protein